MAKLGKKTFTKNARIGISLIVVAVFAIAAVVAAAIILPKVAPDAEPTINEIAAIVADNEGIISVDADLTKVFATIKYIDGSEKKVALSELIVSGLDTSDPGILSNVILDFGGFKQSIRYEVVPTLLDVEYVSSTGGRVEGDTYQQVPAGSDASRVQAIPDEGYKFVKWSDGNPNGSRVDRQVAASQKLIAVFEKRRYAVVFFYPDGTTAREEIVAYNESPTRIPRATETNMRLYGYKFVGFDKDYTRITDHTDIFPFYEKYAADNYLEYTLDSEGVPLGTSDSLPFYEKDQVATIRVLANPDRLFIGWSVRTIDGIWINLQPKSEQRLIKVAVDHNIQFRTSQTGTSEEYALNFLPDSEVDELHIRAHFVYIESEISFTSMSIKARDSFTINYDQPIGDSFNVEDLTYLSMLGYEFKGWAVKNASLDEFGLPIIINNSHKFSQPSELVAQWEKKIYQVVFLQGNNENSEFISEAKGYDPIMGGRVLEAYYQDSLAGALQGSFPDEPIYYLNHTFKGWYVRGEDLLPTSQSVDKTYKIDREITYIVPVFTINTVNLSVNILEGAGTIVNLVLDDENPELGDSEFAIRGQFKMAVNGDYRFRVKAAAGYKLVQVKIGDVTIDMPPDQGDYDFTINSPLQPRTVSARFRMAQYNITLYNGTVGTEGTIVYNDANEAETGYVSSEEQSISFLADYGASKNIEIMAQDGFYIMSVVSDGVSQPIPYLASYYTVRLSSVSRNIMLSITYRDFRYRVELPEVESVENGSISLLDPQVDYAKNSNPRVEIIADAGYYVKSVSFNGWTIDPYQPIVGFSISSIKILGEDYETGDSLDPRVTYMVVTINGIKADANFEIVFDRVYYNVKVTSQGNGTADESASVLFGNNIDIKAETVEGYYISSIEVDGVAQSLVGLRTSIVHTLTNVVKDFSVNFIFAARRIAVSFTPSEKAIVAYKNINYPISMGKTFTGITGGSNNTFSINAGVGNQIDSIEYYASTDDQIIFQEDISFSATVHVLQLDNIFCDYVVTVTTKPLRAGFTLFILNKEATAIIANGMDIGPLARYEETVVYGENLTIEVLPDIGLGFSIDSVFIRNKDTRNPYSYTQTTYLDDSISDGQYFVYTNMSVDNLIIAKVRSNIDIYITLEDLDPIYDMHLELPENGTLSASALISGVPTEVNDALNIPSGTQITLKMTPSSGYMLVALILNGKRVISGISEGQYIMTMGAISQLVSAVFVPNRYNVTVDNSDSNGTVTTESAIFSEGQSFQIKASARKGYTVKSLSVTVSNPLVIHPVNVGINNQIFVYDIPVGYTTSNIVVKATFEAIGYILSLDMTGNGVLSQDTGIKNVKYGDTLSMHIDADEFHFIESILINGVLYSAFDLTERVDNYDADEVESGNISLEITGDTTVLVNFLPNEYKINLVADFKGQTLFKKVTPGGISSQFVPATDLVCNSGDKLWLKMTANEGYHISSVIVNGAVNNAWKTGNTRDNDLTEVFFELMVITAKVKIQVLYEVNVYSMKVNASNISVNYKDFDKTPQDYGKVTIVGFLPNAENEYTGFAHGSNIRVFIQPRTARGYYIDRFSIRFSDGTEIVISDIDMPRDGGSYSIYNLVNDIDEVRVDFRRRLFTFSLSHTVDQLGSPYAWTGNVQAVFTNPYSSGAEIALVDGSYYEYGTTFELFLSPGMGYKRTQFIFNGEDRKAYVRSNKYTGVLTTNITAEVEFTIDKFTITMEQNYGGITKIRDEANNVIWAPGITILQPGDTPPSSGEYVNSEVTTTKGHIWIYVDRIEATFDAVVRLYALPNNYTNGVSTQGYRVSSFMINSSLISVSGDAAAYAEYSVRTNINARASFSINRYNVEVMQFEGGSATANPHEVVWDNSSIISIILSKGYYISSVKVNGVQNDGMQTALSSTSSYTMTNIREHKSIQIALERNKYDVTFVPTGDYKKTFSINNGERVLTAVSSVGLNENVPRKEPQYFRTTNDTILETGEINSLNGAGEYIGLRFGDKLIFHLTIPNGFEIEVISVLMDDEGFSETSILSSEAGLDADDGTGTRTFTIGSVTGNVKIYFKYRIKTYLVTYVLAANGEFADMNISAVAHHQKVTWDIIADYGYYLTQLEINGVAYKVSSNTLSYIKVDSLQGKRYRYSTDVFNIHDELIPKEISDALVNGSKNIRIVPYFAPLYFSAVIQINSRLTNDNLSVNLSNNRIMYDPSVRAVFAHSLEEGYSIASIEFRNSDAYDYLSYQLTLNQNSVLEEGEFNAKDSLLSLPAYGELIDIMDFHSPYQKLMRVFYLVQKDEHLFDFSFHLIESELDGTGLNYINKGNSFSDDGLIPKIEGVIAAFSTSREFTDNKAPSAPHEYGVFGLLNSAVDPVAQTKYEFAGYQEKTGDTWSYVTSLTQNIELLSNGRTMRVNLKKDRIFRAVFFRLYKVQVEVHPEFKYVQGSFATSEPDLMNYRLYSGVFASVQHFADLSNGVVLPNISNMYVDIPDVNTENLDGKYEFLVRSGATLTLRTIDRSPTVNLSRSYVYYDITKTSYSYSQGSSSVEYDRGVSVRQDKLVYSYARNNLYVSFAMETEGSLQANAGGKITYIVNGTVSSLVNNSLVIAPDSTIEATIKTNANYRFDSISSLLYLSRGSEDGYRRSTGVFTPLTTTSDNQTVVTYYDIANNPVNPGTYMGRIATVKVVIKNVSENTILKVKFWKQIEFTRSLVIMTDEGLSTLNVNKRPNFKTESTSIDGTYDFGDDVTIKLNFPSPAYAEWDVRWQFVGFYVNGVNLFKNLSQSYPTQTEVVVRLDDSAKIKDKIIGGATVFAVDIVAKFIPVYNIVIENEYKFDPLDSLLDIYLNPEYITYDVIPYNIYSMIYTRDSDIINAKEEAIDHNESSFKMMGKINTSSGVKDIPTSGYNTWTNNEITLNWAGSALAGPTYKFLGWQYYKYNSFSNQFSWENIPYVKALGGSQGTMDYKRPLYTFPISSIVSSSYYSLFTSEGGINLPGAKTSIWTQNPDTLEWTEQTAVPAIRIRPLFQKMVPVEIVKQVASEQEDIFSSEGASGIRPVIMENSLPAASFEYYKTIVMDPAIRAGYEFNGWYFVVDDVYEPLTDTAAMDLKQIGSTDVYMSYKYTTSNKRLDIRLDWLEGEYKIVARYIRIFSITIEVVSASGNAPYIVNALPNIAFYGQATKNGQIWTDPAVPLLTQRKVTFTSYVGNRLVFKLSTGYDALKPNDWTKFNPRFDKLESIDDLEINLNSDMWLTGDSSISSNVVFGISDVLEIENATYRIAANGDKYIKIFFRTEADLIIHNVYCNSFIRLPDALAIAKGFKPAGSTEKIYIKDNGPNDSDSSPGIIRIENIPVQPGINYDGIAPGDFGNRISPYLSTNATLSSEIYIRGINLNGNTITSKLAQFSYYGDKMAVQDGYDPITGDPTYANLTSPIPDYPFDGGGTENAGDGTAAKPFLIRTLRHLQNVDTLYNGNIVGGVPTLRYATGGVTYNFNFKLIADIDLYQDDLRLSSPLCSNGYGFDGIFEGYKDATTNYCLYDYRPTTGGDYSGIFARLNNSAIVRNLWLGNFAVSGAQADYVGAIAGKASNNALIQNISTTDIGDFNPSTGRSCSGQKYVGGLIGYLEEGSQIDGCTLLNVQVQGQYQGWITDQNTIANFSPGGVGGIAGVVADNKNLAGTKVKIINCITNKTTVLGKYAVGGIVGSLLSAQSADSEASISNCQAIDPKFSEADSQGYIGGVVGFIGLNRTINNCIMQANTTDLYIYSKWSSSSYTSPVEPACLTFGGGGIAGINLGSMADVTVSGTKIVNLLGSISGGVVGINGGTLLNSSVTIALRTDRVYVGSTLRSGLFGGHVGYNRATGIIEGAQTTFIPANYNTIFAAGSAAYTIYTGSTDWIDNFNIEIPLDPPIMGDDPGSDTSNLYLGGIVGYNRGNVYSRTHQEDEIIVVDRSTQFNGKLLVSRRNNGNSSNNTYIGVIVGYNDTSFNILDAYTSITAKVEYYRYNYVGYKGYNLATPYTYMYDYLGGIYGFKFGSGQVIAPATNPATCYARYEANGGNELDYDPGGGSFWTGYTDAKNFPISRVDLTNSGFTSTFTINNPIDFTFNTADIRTNSYIAPNIKNLGDSGVGGRHDYEYFGKYRQTIVS